MDQDHDFPWTVDIPIPPTGFGPLLAVILDAAKSCAGGAIVTTRSEPKDAEVQRWFNRIATKTPSDAQRIAQTFRSIGAQRVR
jgi:hypothetical protein